MKRRLLDERNEWTNEGGKRVEQVETEENWKCEVGTKRIEPIARASLFSRFTVYRERIRRDPKYFSI